MKTLLTQYFSKTLRTSALGWAAFSVLTGGSTLWAGTEGGYSHDGGVQVSHEAWMGTLPNIFKLSYLSLPGTHDTMSRTGGDIVQTQSMDLQNQLDSGIRVLDIRIDFKNDTFDLSHGAIPQPGNFEGVLETVVRFLMYHPSEVVLMRVKHEHDSGSNKKSFEDVFKTFWNGFLAPYFWKGTELNPTLGEIRGRIVVLQDFSADSNYGIPYKSFSIQDDYSLNTNWDLYNKWTEVKTQLNLAHDVGTVQVPGPHGGYISYPMVNEDLKFMNYLSGATGSFPYFVASGKSSPGTSDPRLATGKTTPGWSDWPDFPRVACFYGICTIDFEGTNNLTYNWLGDNSPKRVGIIMADFPGPGLIGRIIDANHALAQHGF